MTQTDILCVVGLKRICLHGCCIFRIPSVKIHGFQVASGHIQAGQLQII